MFHKNFVLLDNIVSVENRGNLEVQVGIESTMAIQNRRNLEVQCFR